MFAANQYNQPFNNNYNLLNMQNINPNLGVNINMSMNINVQHQHQHQQQQQQQQQQMMNLQHQMNMQNIQIQPMQNYFHPNMQILNHNVQAPLSVPVPVNNLNINLGLNNNNYLVNNQPYYNPVLPQVQSVQQSQPQPQPQPQLQPQPNGGVSEVLDYDIDQMVKFVSWLTFGLLKKCSTPSLTFQNNLHSVLSATRLPKSTLLLAVNYLSIKMDSQIEPYNVESEDEIFKIIVTLLILSNKFNDDKTFRNKSWSDATNLPLAEINQLERNWLKDCNYKLFTTNDYETVENCWDTWCIKNIQSFDSFELSQPQILNDDFQYLTPVSSVPSSPIIESCQFSNGIISNQIFENPYQQHQFQPISPINDCYYLNDYNNIYTNQNNSFYNGYDYSYNNHYPTTTNSTCTFNYCTAAC